MTNFAEKLDHVTRKINEKLDIILPEDYGTDETRIEKAMRYSCLSNGKRLRPFLVVCSGELFGVSENSALMVASAIELIHNYSLIHDDLPAMDDDNMRRGRNSCHIEFDEATAILAGDALCTYAFEILADRSCHPDASVRCELITSVAKAAGYGGMVGGQMLDILSTSRDLSVTEVIRMQRLKTGKLFEVSCESGAILGRASQQLRNALKGFAYSVGLAYQIKDDLLDYEAQKEVNKPTLINAMGVDKAREQVKLLEQQAQNHLAPFGTHADILREFASNILVYDN